jgi:hypothetical protein
VCYAGSLAVATRVSEMCKGKRRNIKAEASEGCLCMKGSGVQYAVSSPYERTVLPFLYPFRVFA